MSTRWAVALPMKSASLLGPLRCRSGLEICQQDETVWLRGTGLDDALDARLRALPGTRFEVLPDGQLILIGNKVPKGHSPGGPWHTLRQWLTADTEPAAIGGSLIPLVALRVVRGGPMCEANVLLTTVEPWRTYAKEAPQVRLDALAFAVSDASRIAVRGSPLPPIAGTRYVAKEGVAVPAGHTWLPSLSASVVREVLQLAPNDLALLHPDGTWDHIKAEDFARATRSAIRLTANALVHDATEDDRSAQ